MATGDESYPPPAPSSSGSQFLGPDAKLREITRELCPSSLPFIFETESHTAAEAGPEAAAILPTPLSSGIPGVSHHIPFKKLLLLLLFLCNRRDVFMFSCVNVGSSESTEVRVLHPV